MNQKPIPGWNLQIDEVSNGVFKVTLTDAYGRIAEIIDSATDETIEKAIGYAFEIEKQISRNWSLFLFGLALQNLSDNDFKYKEYEDQSFGSWIIEGPNRRLLYDGQSVCLILQTKTKEGWTDIHTLSKDEVNYLSFINLINRLTDSATPINPKA